MKESLFYPTPIVPTTIIPPTIVPTTIIPATVIVIVVRFRFSPPGCQPEVGELAVRSHYQESPP